MKTQQTKQKANKKQKPNASSLLSLYKDISFHSIPSTGRPGTPHRYFASSYHVKIIDHEQHTLKHEHDEHIICVQEFVVHSHVNGLCILTIGQSLKTILDNINNSSKSSESNQNNLVDEEQNIGSSSTTRGISCTSTSLCHNNTCTTTEHDEIQIQQISFMVNTTKNQSVGQKRKEAKKMKRGNVYLNNNSHNNQSNDDESNNTRNNNNNNNNNNGMIQPGTLLLQITLTNGSIINVPSCICGTVLELNSNIIRDPMLLVNDPLLDGYLAVVLPNGSSFPPKGIRVLTSDYE